MDLHGLAEERSLEYHRRVAAMLHARPDLVADARRRAAAWLARGGSDAPYARQWLEILDGRIEEIARRMQDPSERGRALRQATPFAGALGPRDRWRLWREVREKWESR